MQILFWITQNQNQEKKRNQQFQVEHTHSLFSDTFPNHRKIAEIQTALKEIMRKQNCRVREMWQEWL